MMTTMMKMKMIMTLTMIKHGTNTMAVILLMKLLLMKLLLMMTLLLMLLMLLLMMMMMKTMVTMNKTVLLL